MEDYWREIVTENYYLNFPDKKVSKKDAVKAGCYVYEMVDLTTKNEALGCPVPKDKEKAVK